MSLTLRFHNFIEKSNVLEQPTKRIHDYLKRNPTLFKVVLVANHVFRTLTMYFFMTMLPYSTLTSTTICLTASLIYRLTVETNCAYKFSLPSLGGALALSVSQKAFFNLVNQTTLLSFKILVPLAGSFVPLSTYFIYVILTVSYDVDKNCLQQPLSCCK